MSRKFYISQLPESFCINNSYTTISVTYKYLSCRRVISDVISITFHFDRSDQLISICIEYVTFSIFPVCYKNCIVF